MTTNMKKMTTKIMTSLIVILPIIISIIALLHSTGVITRFKLEILIDSYLIPKTTLPDDYVESFPIILPITFVNSGNHTGVIEDIILIVSNKITKDTRIYSPVSEIDLQKYINGKRALHAENIFSPFFSFHIEWK
jgi:hypothetical protein